VLEALIQIFKTAAWMDLILQMEFTNALF